MDEEEVLLDEDPEIDEMDEGEEETEKIFEDEESY